MSIKNNEPPAQGANSGENHIRPAKRNRSALFLVIFGVCMVSYSGPMVKGALNAGATPTSVALIRMLAAGLLLLPFDLSVCIKRRISFVLNRSQCLWTLLAAIFLSAHYLTWITSLEGTSTFASVALVCTQPIFVSLFSFFLFHETLPRPALPGAAIAMLGAVFIALSGLLGTPNHTASQNGELLANLLALLGAVMMAAHWLTARHIRQTLPAEVYTPVLYLLTAAILAIILPLTGHFSMPLSAIPYMIGLVLGSTLLGHTLFSFALSRVSASVVSFALLGEPVGAMLFAMLFLGEIPSLWVLLGGALTLVGLCLYLAFAEKKAPKAQME